MSAALDIETVVDEQRTGWTLILVVFVAMLVLVSDGFDLAAMGYVAPELAREWGLTPGAFVPAFSAGIIGMMIGGPLMGFLGDRFGRKVLIVWGLVAIGVLTLASVMVRSTPELVALRFFTGIALGGVIPNVGALIAELSPRRMRGRMLVIVTLGVPIGIALPGLVAATLVPAFGWRSIFVVGGLLPLLVALASVVALPESLKHLVTRGGREAKVRSLVQRLRPELAIAAGTRFEASAPVAARRGSFRSLFSGDFALVTPLLWLCQAANQMANFFALTWLPTLLQAGGASSAHAGANASLFSLGGLLSGVLLIFVLDKVGIIPVVLLFVVGVPLVASLALTGLSPEIHALVILGAGVCVTGVQIGLTALLGIFYPTHIRSSGVGWTQAAGRVGALAAPLAGGVLLTLDVPIETLPLAPAALMVVGAVACAALAWCCVRRLGSWRPSEFQPTPTEAKRETSVGYGDAR